MLDDGFQPTTFREDAVKGVLQALAVTPASVSHAIVQAAQANAAKHPDSKQRHSKELLDLVQQRRKCKEAAVRRNLSKQIYKALREERLAKTNANLERIIDEGRSRKSLARVLDAGRRRDSIHAVVGMDGHLKSSQDEIAGAFADFYEKLYEQLDAPKASGRVDGEDVAPIALEEVCEGCKLLKSGRACAEDGLVAEMLKPLGPELLEIIAVMFTDVLTQKAGIPEEWRSSKVIVLFKKGCPKALKNYRPLTILPVLYKLFAVILLKRIKGKLEGLQPDEQSGFRPERSCSDVVHILRQVPEKSQDWGLTVWAASLDLEKAFDKVFHGEVIEALQDAGIDAHIVAWLRGLYLNQAAYVQAGQQRSRLFHITRGVRQGDPLSPVLFINVTRKLMATLKEEWEKKGFGSIVGAWADQLDKLTFTSFADDTTILARSRASLTSMLRRLNVVFANAGLKLNHEKCVVQTNAKVVTSSIKVDHCRFPSSRRTRVSKSWVRSLRFLVALQQNFRTDSLRLGAVSTESGRS